MSTDRDVTRIVRSWLHEDAHEDADRLLALVLDQVDTTQQRRATWLARRFPVMNNNAVRLGIAAAAVVLVAFLGIKFLPWSSTGDPIETPTATADASPSSSASTSPAPPTTEYVSDSAFPVRLTLSLPAGWQAVSGPTAVTAFRHTTGLGLTEFGIYVVENLYADACQPTLGWRDPPLGPTADDLVTALTKLPVYAGASISTTEIGGYAAIHLDRATAHSTPAACKVQDVYGAPGSAFDYVVGRLALGGYADVWVVDVDGQRLLIVRSGDPQGFEEVDAILASLRIGP